MVTAATKVATGRWAARRAGIGPRGRWRTGTALVARGEFSIVIAGLAVAAGLEETLGPLAATYVLVLAILGPILARASDPLGQTSLAASPAIRDERRIVARTPADRGSAGAMSTPATLTRSNGATGE
jgi:monovalent cation:H+ antiporter-2, CPA2 family